jgi:hypothetical protein
MCKVAVLLMNNRNTTANVSVSWAELPPDMHFHCSAGGCPVRDIHDHKDLGTSSASVISLSYFVLQQYHERTGIKLFVVPRIN